MDSRKDSTKYWDFRQSLWKNCDIVEKLLLENPFSVLDEPKSAVKSEKIV